MESSTDMINSGVNGDGFSVHRGNCELCAFDLELRCVSQLEGCRGYMGI
jgi:hypothetical protein